MADAGKKIVDISYWEYSMMLSRELLSVNRLIRVRRQINDLMVYGCHWKPIR